MNNELEKVAVWFKANKLSLNVSKQNIHYFILQVRKDFFQTLKIDKININRDSVTKFLGVLIDENLSWKSHINSIDTKISKSIGVLYKSRNLLNKQLLKQFYFAFIHSYLSYGNIAWGSNFKTKLDPLCRRQKHAIRVINYEGRFTHTNPLLIEMKILSLYKINIFQVLCFMFKCKFSITPGAGHMHVCTFMYPQFLFKSCLGTPPR